MAHLETLPNSYTPVDWGGYNKKEETLQLIESVGGLTENMRAFMKVYEGNEWGFGSGGGSALPFAARTICLLSSSYLSLLNITLLVDLPCGDQQWAPTLRALAPGLKYIGVDAMPGLVQRNREVFGHGGPGEPEFWLADMAAEGGGGPFASIRERSKLWTDADRVAVLSRHVLEHNTFNTSASYLAHLKRSGALYFIGTTALPEAVPVNTPIIVPGGYTPLNMLAAPYNFPHGVLRWFETGQVEGEGTTCMEVWNVLDIPDY